MGAKNEIGGISGINVGEETEILLMGDVTNKTHEFWYRLIDGGWVKTNGPKFTLPIKSTCEKYPNTSTIQISLCARTYENGVNLGDSYHTATMYIPSNIAPTASIVELTEANTQVANAGEFLLGLSKIKARLNASGIYGSTIKNMVVTSNGNSVNVENGVAIIPCDSQKITIKLTVTDSRGMRATATKNVTAYKYAEPFVWELKTYRCNKAGYEDEEGTYFACEFMPEVALYPGNLLSYRIEKQMEGDTGWVQTANKTGLSQWGTIKEVASIGTDSTYTIKLTLYDKVSDVYYMRKVLSTYNVMDVKADGNGIAFGRACTENGFACAMKSLRILTS